ncbi:UNVERIFIED_CONTAM: ABSCISIC ACID-INSENSITIVE 5-like protein 2 [Sesamum radiatum]|uniref:ABSCISIC ACID-INSENSITIVE 5-like protein 2 n=1 Tax=Sesamum radiatum TaxID=300843 RepID=A0AAW2NA11_SESRA
MIKNRESAARSRARKQAYTHELENKVSRLEEENERLKRQKVPIMLNVLVIAIKIMLSWTLLIKASVLACWIPHPSDAAIS